MTQILNYCLGTGFAGVEGQSEVQEVRDETDNKRAFCRNCDAGFGHEPPAWTGYARGISERQHISLSYLEQLFGKLRRRELVTSVRGPGGGYCLGREMANISVADIIRAVDEVLDATQCGGKSNCHAEHICMTHNLWANLNKRMYTYLDSVTLADMVKEQQPNAATVLHDQRPMRRAKPRSEEPLNTVASSLTPA